MENPEVVLNQIVEAQVKKAVGERLSDDSLNQPDGSINAEKAAESAYHKMLVELEKPDSPIVEVKGLYQSLKEDLDGLDQRVTDIVKSTLAELDRNRTSEPDVVLEWKQITDVDRRGNFIELSIEDAIFRKMSSDPYLTKAITTYDSTPGARQGAMTPWQQMHERNPFRQFVSYLPMAGAGSFSLPVLTQADFADTANTSASIADALALTSATHNLATQTLKTAVTKIAGSEVPGIRDAVLSMIGMRAAAAHGKKCEGVIESSVESSSSGSFSSINTGTASSATDLGLPTAANIIGKLADLIAVLDTPYRDGIVIFCTRAFYAQLKKATTGTAGAWAYDPAMRAERYDGIPIIATSHIANATSATSQMVAFAGDLAAGITLAEGVPLRVEEYDETLPGSTTYFAQMHYLYVVTDRNAVVGMKTGT